MLFNMDVVIGAAPEPEDQTNDITACNWGGSNYCE